MPLARSSSRGAKWRPRPPSRWKRRTRSGSPARREGVQFAVAPASAPTLAAREVVVVRLVWRSGSP
ncbi:MAG: hypothetical protein ABSH35_30165 [Isosphaeraceae bacterium]